MTREDLRDCVRERLIHMLLWGLRRVEPCKNRALAVLLHDVADRYDPRPTGQWSTDVGTS